MAKSVKTDLFADIMKAPEKPKKQEKPEKVVEKVTKAEPAEVEVPEKTTTQKAERSLDQFLKRVERPSAGSHTFYLKDTVYNKLIDTAKEKGTSPSKLLEALIEVTL